MMVIKRLMKFAIYYERICYFQYSKKGREGVKCPEKKDDVWKYIDELKEMSLSEETILIFASILQEFEDKYQDIEKDLFEIWLKAMKTKLWVNLDELYDKTKVEHSQEWKKIVQKAESKIIEISDHIEDYNNYFGANMAFGLLQRPKISSCSEKNKCKKCLDQEISEQQESKEH